VECGGIHLIGDDRDEIDSYLISLTIIKTLFELYPKKTEWREPPKSSQSYFFDLLMGSDRVREEIDQGVSPEEIINSWEVQRKKFCSTRKKFLLY
jgi:uncharacterized protein YbbC (DUF1343 family)